MTADLLPVTFTAISLVAIVLIFMTAWVGIGRGKQNLRGDGGNPVLYKRIRIHGNLVENAPIFILTLGACEVAGLSSTWLWLALLSFVVGRFLHYKIFDMTQRGFAMLMTQLPGVLMGIWLLIKIYV